MMNRCVLRALSFSIIRECTNSQKRPCLLRACSRVLNWASTVHSPTETSGQKQSRVRQSTCCGIAKGPETRRDLERVFSRLPFASECTLEFRQPVTQHGNEYGILNRVSCSLNGNKKQRCTDQNYARDFDSFDSFDSSVLAVVLAVQCNLVSD